MGHLNNVHSHLNGFPNSIATSLLQVLIIPSTIVLLPQNFRLSCPYLILFLTNPYIFLFTSTLCYFNKGSSSLPSTNVWVVCIKGPLRTFKATFLSFSTWNNMKWTWGPWKAERFMRIKEHQLGVIIEANSLYYWIAIIDMR